MAQHWGRIVRNPSGISLDRIGDVLAFVRVADARSFTLAAERMGVSRSAIGKSIARLEESLATRLVHRTTRSVSLSDEGQLFYDYAVRIVSEALDAETAMAQRNEVPRGRLRIDLPVSFGRLHVMPILLGFLEKWPGLEADVTFSDDYSDPVREGIDLAIRIGGNDDSSLIRRKLAPHRLVTCATPAYFERNGMPETPEDLARHAAIVFTHARMPSPWRYRVGGRDRAFPVQGRMFMSNTEAIRDAVLAGSGLAQISTFLVGGDLRAGRLVPVLEAFSPQESPVCAVYPNRRHLPPKVRHLIDEIDRCWAGGAPWE